MLRARDLQRAERDADGLGDLFAAHSALDQIFNLLEPFGRFIGLPLEVVSSSITNVSYT